MSDGRIARIDPQVMIVAVGNLNLSVERDATVGRLVETGVERVDRVDVLRIGVDVNVVPGALLQFAVVIGAAPGIPGVVGSSVTK